MNLFIRIVKLGIASLAISLLDSIPLLLQYVDEDGMNALLYSIQHLNVDVIDWIVSAGESQSDQPQRKLCEYPVHLAIKKYITDLDVYRLLFRAAVDLDQQDEQGNSIVHLFLKYLKNNSAKLGQALEMALHRK